MKQANTSSPFKHLQRCLTAALQKASQTPAQLNSRQIGRIVQINSSVAQVQGLTHAKAEEYIIAAGRCPGMISGLDNEHADIVFFADDEQLKAGDEIHCTGRLVDVPVGEALIGRIIDATGRILDEGSPLPPLPRWPIEQEAPAIMQRAPVSRPLYTGIKAIDALVPIGRGQRELILGDRQTGKTATAVDTLLNQHDQNVLCIYCAIGQRKASVVRVIEELKQRGAMDYTIVLVASGEDPPGLRSITPYAATTIGEYFMRQGRDVLIVYDDLTQHARAYRELALLLERPPGREAYPGDIFYIHSRLLERATQLRDAYGGGSMTALPIVETQAQNIAAYIPTNLISITDGQLYLSSDLFQQGQLPAVDVGKSVSRVGGQAQTKAYSKIAGELRLAYTQYQELEDFARFATVLSKEMQQTLDRGRKLRELLKQSRYQGLSIGKQYGSFLAVTQGIFDSIPIGQIRPAETTLQQQLANYYQRFDQLLADDQLIDTDLQNEFLEAAHNVIVQQYT